MIIISFKTFESNHLSCAIAVIRFWRTINMELKTMTCFISIRTTIISMENYGKRTCLRLNSWIICSTFIPSPHFCINIRPCCISTWRSRQTIITILSLNRHTSNTLIVIRLGTARNSLPNIWSIPTRITVSVMSAAPKYFGLVTNTFAVVDCNVVVFPVEIVFAFEIHHLTYSTRTQDYIMFTLSC